MCYLGDAEKAQTYLEANERIIKQLRESSYYLSLGFIYESLNKRTEAKNIYQLGLKRTPDSKVL